MLFMYCCDVKKSLLLNIAPFCSFLYSTDRVLSINSHYCTSEHNSTQCSLFEFIPHTRLSLSTFITGHPRSTLLFLCIPQTLFSLLRIIIVQLSSTLLFLCIPQTLLSYLRVISVYPSSTLFFMHSTDIVFIRNSHMLHIQGPFCSFYAFCRPCSHSQQSLLKMEAVISGFMHCINLAVRLKSHCFRTTDLFLTVRNH